MFHGGYIPCRFTMDMLYIILWKLTFTFSSLRTTIVTNQSVVNIDLY